MAFAEWHPDEERLLNRYLDSSDRDETLDRHLARCRPCVRRFRALKLELDTLYQRAIDAADDAFDEQRLQRQRAMVVERLGGVAPGRVLRFPVDRLAGWRPSLPHRALRPIAAAALVLMVAGLGAGHLVSVQLRHQAGAPRTDQQASAAVVATTGHAPEDLIFADIDMALVQPRTAELRAIDELTPHAADLVASVR